MDTKTNTITLSADYTPQPTIGARRNNKILLLPIIYGQSNRTMACYDDANLDFNCLMFNQSKGIFQNTYSNLVGDTAIETSIMNILTKSWDFDFRTFFAQAQAGATDSCTYSGSGDWGIIYSDNCNIVTEVTGEAGKMFSVGGSPVGSFKNTARIKGFRSYYFCNCTNCYLNSSGGLG